MTEESEIFRITNSHTYHSALKSENSTNSEKSYCFSQSFKIKIQCFKKMINFYQNLFHFQSTMYINSCIAYTKQKQAKTAGRESGCVFNYRVEMVVTQFAIFDFTIYVHMSKLA